MSFFIITTLHIVLGEQAPKVFAIRAPEWSVVFVARPLTLFNRVFGVVIRFLDWATTSVLRLFGMPATSEHTKVHSAEELRLLVEEIIGDLDAEIKRAAKAVVRIDTQTTVVDGQMRVEEINADLDLNIPQREYETVAGFILTQLGRLPTPGDQLVYQRLRLTVVEMQGPRIKRVELKRV